MSKTQKPDQGKDGKHIPVRKPTHDVEAPSPPPFEKKRHEDGQLVPPPPPPNKRK